ncbi:transposase [Streptomyces sp. NPDC003327]
MLAAGPHGRQSIGGSPSGPRRGCGRSSIAWCWTSSAPAGSRTGRGARSAPWTCEPSKGGADRPASCRSRQEGSKIHFIAERTGLPISIGISAASTHDSQGLEPLVRGIPPIRSRRRRLRRRYERKAEHFLAFTGISATLICYRREQTEPQQQDDVPPPIFPSVVRADTDPHVGNAHDQ